MNSAALLYEAVIQLAEKYWERKQRELNRHIGHADCADEPQRARHRIAGRNVFSVDSNPIALELAKLPLWLNGIHQDCHVPWPGYQPMCGNSLVGTRRQAHLRSKLAKQKEANLWFTPLPRSAFFQLFTDGLGEVCLAELKEAEETQRLLPKIHGTRP